MLRDATNMDYLRSRILGPKNPLALWNLPIKHNHLLEIVSKIPPATN